MNLQTKKLEEVCEVKMGQSPASSTYNDDQNGLPFYQGKKDYGEKFPTPRVWCSAPIKIVEAGDILISVRAPVGALNIASEKSCIGRGLAGLRATKELDQDFLYHFLKLKEKDIANLGTGSTFTAISKKHLENLEISLPPITEQRKIVAKLEKVLGKIKEAKKLRAESESAAAALLPAELHKILSEGKKNGWEEKELGNLMSTITPPAKIKKKDFKSQGKYPVLDQSQNEIAGWTDDLNALVEVEKPVVIFGDHTCAVKYSETRFAQGADGIKILATSDSLLPKFLYLILKNQPVKSEGYRRHFYKLKEIKIPLPPLAEQKKIVARLDALSAKVQNLRQAQTKTASDFTVLEQSVLHQAFNVK